MVSNCENALGFLEQTSIVIAVHTAGHSVGYDLERFLKRKAKSLLFINHPFSFVKRVFKQPTDSTALLYQDGVIARRITVPPIKGPELLFWIKDFLLTIFFVFKLGRKYDVFIGIDNLNAFTGLFLKKLGMVRKVIFYTIDYVPQRFSNKFLNGVYHWVDRICCFYCDCVWNVASVIAEERGKVGIVGKMAFQITVPIGVAPELYRDSSLSEINRRYLVYMGGLSENQGVQLVIDALSEITTYVSGARLLIGGAGPFEEDLKKRAKERGVTERIDFLGYIEDQSKIADLLSTCAVGLATYTANPANYKFYCDPTKPKTYMAAGLPVILTRVPQLSSEVERRGAGVVINYDKAELIDAVVKLLTDDEFYVQCRRNAIEFAKEFAFERIYSETLRRTFKD